MTNLKVWRYGSAHWALWVNNAVIGIFDTYVEAEREKIKYLRVAGLDENGKAFDAEIVKPQVIRKPLRVDIDVNELSVEDVNCDAALIYGAFGAQHEEPEPVTAWEIEMDSYERPSFYYGE